MMTKKWLSVTALCAMLVPCGAKAQCVALVRSDTLWSPSRDMFLALKTWEAGTQRMTVRRANGEILLRVVRDLVNAVWMPNGKELVFAESPIYGDPGIYLWSPSTSGGMIVRLVRPETITKTFPDGEDWFDICGVAKREDGSTVVLYLHYPSVDHVDFAKQPLTGTPDTVVVDQAPRRLETGRRKKHASSG